MASELRVSDDLALPLDAVTQSFALLAVRRAGKSNAAAVLAEEMYKASLPWVAIDPKGDWWGLRSSKDGTGPGLPIPLFGGLHGDVPLTPESGRLIAEIVATENVTCILDVSDFPSKAAQMRFLTDFAEHLFRLHRKNPQPRHVFLEEADEYLPQRVMQDQAKCVGAWTKMVKQGGAFGLGVTLISQRSAVVNKDALTQVETLIALRTTSPQDRAAIKAWTDYHDASREIVDSLPGLDDGEAWVLSPHWLTRHGQPAVQRTRFRQRSTFDSGATPTMASARQRPATLADIDLGSILGRMEAVAEKAANEDPAVLRKRIAALEKQLAAKPSARHSDEVALLRGQVRDLTAALGEARSRPPERIEVPVVTPGDIAAFEQATATLRDIAGGVELALSRAAAPARTQTPAVAPPRDLNAGKDKSRPAVPAATPAPGAPALGKAHRAFLAVLAQFPEGRSRSQLSLLSGYSVKSSMMDKALSQLRSAGMVEPGQPLRITAAGVQALGGEYEQMPTSGPELLDAYMALLGKAERAFLQALLGAWPGSLTKAQIAEATGYSDKSSMLDKALSRLRTLNLISGTGEIRADETLVREVKTVAKRRRKAEVAGD